MPPKLISRSFSIPWCRQGLSLAWLAKTMQRPTTFQPTPGADPAHPATLSARARTPASPVRASARTAPHPSIGETLPAAHPGAEGPYQPRANQQTCFPVQRHRSTRTSFSARLQASQRLLPQRPRPHCAELVSISSRCSPISRFSAQRPPMEVSNGCSYFLFRAL